MVTFEIGVANVWQRCRCFFHVVVGGGGEDGDGGVRRAFSGFLFVCLFVMCNFCGNTCIGNVVLVAVDCHFVVGANKLKFKPKTKTKNYIQRHLSTPPVTVCHNYQRFLLRLLLSLLAVIFIA